MASSQSDERKIRWKIERGEGWFSWHGSWQEKEQGSGAWTWGHFHHVKARTRRGVLRALWEDINPPEEEPNEGGDLSQLRRALAAADRAEMAP